MGKSEFDQFYTKQEVAKNCFEVLMNVLNNKKFQFIEPAAGTGSFFSILPKNQIRCNGKKVQARLGFDIEPKTPFVKYNDFLSTDLDKNKLLNKGNVVIITNPPFGVKSKLAIEFFNKSTEYASTIAMIIPKQFQKWSVQSKLNSEYKLVSETELDENSFIYNEKDYPVRCVFQIWTSLPTSKPDLRIKEKPATAHPDFNLFQYNATETAKKFFDYSWDFAVLRQGYGDYSTLHTNKKELSAKKQWIFFKANGKAVLNRLKKIDFVKLSRKNTTVPGFGKADVISEYTKRLKKC